MTVGDLIQELKRWPASEEIQFNVFNHWYNPKKDKTSHGRLVIKKIVDNYGDPVLLIGRPIGD